ncbi:hypothetical protein ACFL6C_10445 [Myxococcota bacterium]
MSVKEVVVHAKRTERNEPASPAALPNHAVSKEAEAASNAVIAAFNAGDFDNFCDAFHNFETRYGQPPESSFHDAGRRFASAGRRIGHRYSSLAPTGKALNLALETGGVVSMADGNVIDPNALVPPEPGPQHRIDPKLLWQHLQTLDSDQAKKATLKLIGILSFVSHDEMSDRLNAGVKALKDCLVENERCMVLWDKHPHSSRRWNFERIHEQLAPLVIGATYEPEHLSEWTALLQHMKEQGSSTALIVDDGIYSGTQASDAIQALSLARSRSGDDGPIRVVFLVPFITAVGREKLEDFAKTWNVDLTFVPIAERIKTVEEVLTQDELDALEKAWVGDAINMYRKCGLMVLQHRIPDPMSLPDDHRRMLTGDEYGPYRNKHTDYGRAEKMQFERRLLAGVEEEAQRQRVARMKRLDEQWEKLTDEQRTAVDAGAVDHLRSSEFFGGLIDEEHKAGRFAIEEMSPVIRDALLQTRYRLLEENPALRR